MGLKYRLDRPMSIVDDEWMGAGNFDGMVIENPLLGRSQYYIENPGLLETKLMRSKEYLWFAAKTLLDIELLPLQSVIMEELWGRTFPMVICSRGGGKTVPGDTPIKTFKGWTPMKDIRVGDRVYGRDGKLHTVLRKTDKQTDLDMYWITLGDGRTIEACKDHQWVVYDLENNNEELVLTTQQIANHYTNNKNPKYALPINAPIQDYSDLYIEDPTEIGRQFAHALLFFCNTSVSIKNIVSASYPQKLCFLNGFFEVYGGRSEDIYCKVPSSSELWDLADIVRSVGISCKVIMDPVNQLLIYAEGKDEHKWATIESIQYHGKGEGYCISVNSLDNTYITEDYIVTHNSFMLAVYATLKCALVPGTKVVCVGSAFRQAKVVFEYMVNIWKNAPVLRSACVSSSGPRFAIDRCSMTINDSVALFVPIGSGEKIRGLRADTILADEFSAQSPDIFEQVIRGFASVASKPVDNVKALSRRRVAMEKGTLNQTAIDNFQGKRTNQCVISGTTDYAFKHFAEYWRRYQIYIKSKGDLDRPIKLPNGETHTLREYVEDGESFLDSFNYRDYSIIRIPYNLFPDGFMDKKIIASAQSSINKSAFLMEYGACKYPGTKIITDTGCKNIEDIRRGDNVLTHTGKFKPVTKVMTRNVNEKTALIKCYGQNEYVGTTLEHPWFDGKGFVECDKVDSGFLPKLVELHDLNDVVLEGRSIELTHDLGRLVGYYAHTNEIDDSYLKSLPSDIDPLKFLNMVCIGSDNRYILPNILFSNKGFMRGCLHGIAKAGCSHRKERSTIRSHSLNLVLQTRLILSYYGLFSSVGNNDRGEFLIKLIKENHTKFSRMLGYKGSKSGKGKYPCKAHKNGYALKILDKKYEHYSGPVYNLEVEDDHSYCTLSSAVHNCFPTDSEGFFKRTLIEGCVANDKNEISKPSCGIIRFDAKTMGEHGKTYVYGIDPAAERDNFTIVILELYEDHNRIVYCWSTNIKDFQKRRRAGLVAENDYYGFCARKIRSLMQVFPTNDIAIDAQGGGRAIVESLHSKEGIVGGEQFLWPTNRILKPGSPSDYEDEIGLHIIHMCQFSNYEFVSMANHGTRQDFEQKALLFPRFDPITLELAAHHDAAKAKDKDARKTTIYDTLEDCVMEIEALKDELCSIVMTRTSTGHNARDRWDTPEVKTADGKKTTKRKDRYSSLIMANYIARYVRTRPKPAPYNITGGFAHQLAQSDNKNKNAYHGPSWFTEGMKEHPIGIRVKR